MKIVLSKYAGFCAGVKRAVDTVMNLDDALVKNTYIYGDIIHNESVIEGIKNKGISTIYNLDNVKSGDRVIIRSHGVGKDVFEYLSNKSVEVIDLTCPFVKKTQNIVSKHYSEEYKIVIIGKPSHPEVIGINGWCNNTAIILDDNFSPEDLISYEKVCVVVQTTYSYEKFDKIFKKINNLSIKTLVIFKTICYTTMERQNEAERLSKTLDAMVVIGGENSSNTTKLYEICNKYCKNVYLISQPNRLDYKKLKQYKSVGIVSGASTPLEQSMEVLLTMEDKSINSMEQVVALLDEKQNLKKGQKITVVISQVANDGLSVYFDGKSDIKLPKEELACEEYNPSDYQVTQEIEVVVMATKPLKLSQKQILVLKQEEALVATLREGKVFELEIKGFNKGGLTGKYEGFEVFIPAREIKIGFVKELDKYVGKKLRVKALKVEYTSRKKDIVASQKVILEEEKKAREAKRLAKEEEFFANISENDVVTGTVVRFASFGAFVVVNGFDCLAHVSDLSWTNIKNPAEVLELSKSYDFVVLKVDKENKKVSIGYKQLQPKPWELVSDKYAVGDTVTGKIVRIVSFGAFVEIEKGVDGLVHVSQITHEFLENPASLLKVGEEVTAKILAIDVEKEKITLSIKALTPAPVKEVKEEDKKDKKVKKDDDEDMRGWTDSADTDVSIADLLNN